MTVDAGLVAGLRAEVLAALSERERELAGHEDVPRAVALAPVRAAPPALAQRPGEAAPPATRERDRPEAEARQHREGGGRDLRPDPVARYCGDGVALHPSAVIWRPQVMQYCHPTSSSVPQVGQCTCQSFFASAASSRRFGATSPWSLQRYAPSP